ncbi:PhnJ-domain-containing protein, partial [Rhizophagus irregularis]
MNPSPIPRFDNPKIHQSEALMLFGAGREKKIYAVPAYTRVESLAFDDYPFEIEMFEGKQYGDGCPNCLQENAELEKNFCPICKTVFACKNVSIDLYRGEILGIVGESGSGKSTLMKSLYFDEEVTTGAGYLEDFHNGSLNIFTQSEQQKRYIRNTLLGMVYQNPMLGLKMSFSSISNIAEKQIAAGNRHVENMVNRSNELLDKVNIPLKRSKEPPKNFSGGMQQRVQIAKALSSNPPILLLDEVTT